MPSEQQLSVFGLTEFETSVVQDLLTESSKPVEEDKRLCEPLNADWNVCVRLLGPVDAETRNGIPISFEKSKSLELLAWLTTHRERPTRVAARTALWEISVQDATFNNVVSGLPRVASGLDNPMSHKSLQALRCLQRQDLAHEYLDSHQSRHE